MSIRCFRMTWRALALLLALPQLAAAQNWEVRDANTNQVVFPTGLVSMFDDITYPAVTQRSYTIHNISTFDLQIGPCSISAGDPSFTIISFPYFPPQTSATVPHGLSTSMTIQHSTSPGITPGTQTATVQCEVTSGLITFQVQGRVLDPNPYIILQTSKGKNVANNSTFNFGSTQAGTPINQSFLIINLGNQPLTVSLSVSGSAYSVTTSPTTMTIAKGGQATFGLRLLSAFAGTVAGQLRLDNNDPNDNPYTVNLTGSVSAVPAPQIHITDNGNNGAAVAKGSTISLGSVLPNTSLSRSFTISNTGNATLSISNNLTFLTGTGFTIASSPGSSVTAAGSTFFTVHFQAGSVGTYLGTVTLSSNDPDDNPFTFYLQVTVTSTPPPRIRIVDNTTGQTIVPGSTTISFGTPAPNTVVTHGFTIYNDGSATLTLSNPVTFVSGSGFSLSTPPSSATIPAGQITRFSLSFQASAAGPYSSTASLLHNDPAVANPFVFGLQANVVPVTPVVTLTASDPEASETLLDPGQFTLTRTGSTTAPLSVNVSISGTATNGQDYNLIDTRHTFAAGQSTLNIPVVPIDDTVVEDVETVILTLAPGTGYTVGTPANGTVSITNNDFTPCTPSSTLLCLQGGRFEVTLTATANSTNYTGQSVALSDVSGGFWLFAPDNIEVGVKILDGSSVNGKFWLYHDAATDVAYSLTVRDRANPSRTKTYVKPAGSFCGGADIGFFSKLLSRLKQAGLEPDGSGEETYVKATSCVPDTTTACLLGNRFQARVKMGTAYQQVGPVTGRTGFFWFYSPDNFEVFVKVLDGTPVNGKYWVFFGSMTDQAYTVEVTDTTTGVLKSYASPGALCGNGDTSAF